MSHTICNQCWPEAVYIAELNHEYLLAKINNKYCIIQEPCHNDIIFNWPFTPKEDTWQNPGDTDEIFDKINHWKFPKMDVDSAYYFVLACIEAGFDPDTDGILKFWLTDWAGKQIKIFHTLQS